MPGDTILDQAAAVRSGEALDVERLRRFLREHVADDDAPLVIEQFPGGFSNLTYLLKLGDRELVLRRPPFGANIKAGHDMAREYRILSALHPTFGKAPRPLAYSDNPDVIGAPFYVMERVRGVILRNRIPAGLELDPAQMNRICVALVDALAELHQLDYTAVGLGNLGKPTGYTARQVDGWTQRYADARTDDVAAIEQAAAWLRAHVPAAYNSALIHNDFKYDNVVLDPRDLPHIIAILDWEMATLGDPLTDLGTTLAYWIEPDDPPLLRQFGLTYLPGNLHRREIVERYAVQTGRDVSNVLFYYVYGLFKNAVIVQQIYARYRRGFTADQRFAGLIQIVRTYGEMAARAIDRNRIDGLFT